VSLSSKQLQEAYKKNIITEAQFHLLLNLERQEQPLQAQFKTSHILYYLGGLVAISAMTLFMNQGFEKFGFVGLFFIGLFYISLCLVLRHHYERKGFLIPASIFATLVVCLTPLLVYSLQRHFGWWPDESSYQQYHRVIDWHWFWLELSTLLVAVIMLYLYRYPFLVMPLAAKLWYMSIDVCVMLYSDTDNFILRCWVSFVLGIVIIVLAIFVDFRNRSPLDYSHWLYTFGVITIWGSLFMLIPEDHWGAGYLLAISLIFIVCGALLRRRVFLIFGGIGLFRVLSYLTIEVFTDSLIYPLVLSAIGVGIVLIGIYWQKHELFIAMTLAEFLPSAWQKALKEKIYNE